MMEVIRVDLTANAAGDATKTTVPVNGLLHAIRCEFGTAAAGTDTTIEDSIGADFLALTDSNTDAWYLPRAGTHDLAGAARLYAAAGTAVADRLPVVGPIVVTIAQAGNGGTASFYLFIER